MKGSLKFWILVLWIFNIFSLNYLITNWEVESKVNKILLTVILSWHILLFLASLTIWREDETYFSYYEDCPNEFLIKVTSIPAILIAYIVYAFRNFNTFLDRVFHPDKLFKLSSKSKIKRVDIDAISQIIEELANTEVNSKEEEYLLDKLNNLTK